MEPPDNDIRRRASILCGTLACSLLVSFASFYVYFRHKVLSKHLRTGFNDLFVGSIGVLSLASMAQLASSIMILETSSAMSCLPCNILGGMTIFLYDTASTLLAGFYWVLLAKTHTDPLRFCCHGQLVPYLTSNAWFGVSALVGAGDLAFVVHELSSNRLSRTSSGCLFGDELGFCDIPAAQLRTSSRTDIVFLLPEMFMLVASFTSLLAMSYRGYASGLTLTQHAIVWVRFFMSTGFCIGIKVMREAHPPNVMTIESLGISLAGFVVGLTFLVTEGVLVALWRSNDEESNSSVNKTSVPHATAGVPDHVVRPTRDTLTSLDANDEVGEGGKSPRQSAAPLRRPSDVLTLGDQAVSRPSIRVESSVPNGFTSIVRCLLVLEVVGLAAASLPQSTAIPTYCDEADRLLSPRRRANSPRGATPAVIEHFPKSGSLPRSVMAMYGVNGSPPVSQRSV